MSDSDYLLKVEDEYMRLRGQRSFLSALDWTLAQSWEDRGIPLRIVLSAMGDVAKNFKSNRRSGNINSLRYFAQEVEKQFAEWQTSQVGKSKETEQMNYSFAESVSVADEILETLQSLVDGFKKSGLPEPLGSTVTTIRADLQVLVEDVRTKHLDLDTIEDSLKEMAASLSLSLAISIDDDERRRMVEDIKLKYINRTLDNDSRAKLLNRQLRDKFNLPELTLYAF